MTKTQRDALKWLHKARPWGRTGGAFRIQTFRALRRRGFIQWDGRAWKLTALGLREVNANGKNHDLQSLHLAGIPK